MQARAVSPLPFWAAKTRTSCRHPPFPPSFVSATLDDSTGTPDGDVLTQWNRYDLKQMLMKSSISRVPDELRKHEAAQQKPQRGGAQKKIEESSGFAGKGGW